jgi:hypothetical protein
MLMNAQREYTFVSKSPKTIMSSGLTLGRRASVLINQKLPGRIRKSSKQNEKLVQRTKTKALMAMRR